MRVHPSRLSGSVIIVITGIQASEVLAGGSFSFRRDRAAETTQDTVPGIPLPREIGVPRGHEAVF